MMLARFSRGSRHSRMKRASGNTASKNGIRRAFFGVFSSSRIGSGPAFAGCPCESCRFRSTRSMMRCAIGPVACPASSRFESTPGAPGRNSSLPSISQWASPPSVCSWGDTASVSNSSVLPDRGAATMKSGLLRRDCSTGVAEGVLVPCEEAAAALAGRCRRWRSRRASRTVCAATPLVRATSPSPCWREASRMVSSMAPNCRQPEFSPCRR